ncbi:hypothetical protein [Kineosporia sp. NBRC 101731]|uniref:hypothetical protein n=1 Tax=Kineosporia sp. NBRC 101731 TaxID=3032199 RepID=UPI0024A362BB|nr:hypothetical protein [Kineosporia sp. NBRC 101731]GLY31763.1 hypothetical protein Kisp02_51280 [Kineosporia sp. NBRC 101731]
MEIYELLYDGAVDPRTLIDSLAELGVPADRVMTEPYDPSSGDGLPAVMLERGEPGVDFSTVVQVFAELVAGTSLCPLEWAQFLTPKLARRCLVDDDTQQPNRWYLVTPEGGCGVVHVHGDDADEGRIRFLYATTPIAGAPEIPVRAEPDWASR